MGCTDQQQSGKSDEQTQPLPALRFLVQERSRQQHGDEGLGLQHHGCHAGRHAQLHAGEQQAELPDPLHQAVGGQQTPGKIFGRTHEQQKRQRCRGKAQRAQQQGRELGQPPLHDHEIKTPDHDDDDGAEPVRTTHAGGG